MDWNIEDYFIVSDWKLLYKFDSVRPGKHKWVECYKDVRKFHNSNLPLLTLKVQNIDLNQLTFERVLTR